MTAVRLAPAIRARRALVFLDENPSAARFAHALRMCGFDVRTVQGGDPYPVLAGFLSGAQPGELLVIRWPSGSGWVPSAFTRLIMDFGRRLGDSSAAALLLVVDFGWVMHTGEDDPGHARLNVPGDPAVAAAALTASLISPKARPGAATSLTEVLADGLLSASGIITVSDLYGMAIRHFEKLGCDLKPMLFSHGDIEDVAVCAGRPAGEQALVMTARRLVERGERDVPASAAEIAARVYDLHLSEEARTLLRRASLLPDALTPELARVLGAASALPELEEWGLAGTPHPAVRELGLSRLDPAEAGHISCQLRRHHAGARAVKPRTRLTPDSWTLDDRLGHRVYAEAIAAFIRHPDTLPPLTIGIKGPWGAGKTSLMRMVQDLLDPGATGDEPIRLRLQRGSNAAVTNGEVLDRLTSDDAHHEHAEPLAEAGWRPTVWFNPWMYQNGEQVWAGLAHEIITQVTDRLPRAERERFWLELNLARVDREAVRRRVYWLATTRLAPVALGLLVTGLLTAASFSLEALLPGLEGTAAAVASVGSLGSIAAGGMRLTRFFSEAAEGAFGFMLRPPDPLGRSMSAHGPTPHEDGYRDRTGFLHLVQTDMRRVLDLVATERRPLVVFVDDLDRCSSGTVSKVIEAVNLFLAGEFPNCVFVLAMEPEVVAAHVEMAYRELMDAMPDDGSAKLGWRFLEKIVQLPLSVPLLDDDERLPAYIRALLTLPSPAVTTSPSPSPSPDVITSPPAAVTASPSVAVTASPPVAESASTAPADDPSPVTGVRKGATAPSLRRLLSGAGPKVQPGPARTVLTPELVNRLENVIRGFSPTIDTLDEAAHRAQLALGVTTSPGRLAEPTRQAAERVFDDLYSDENAFYAIESTLTALSLRNPREVKRYLNVFRFYSFVTYRRHLAGHPKTTDEAVAKLSALTIGWPHLLAVLIREAHPGATFLDRLEEAALRTDGDTWQRTLLEAGLTGEDSLRQLLATRPPIAPLAKALL